MSGRGQPILLIGLLVFAGEARILAAVSVTRPEATMTLKRLSVVLLACLTLSACGGVDPNSPLGQRKAIFKQMLKTGEDLGACCVGGFLSTAHALPKAR